MSTVHQSESAVHIHISPLLWISLPFHRWGTWRQRIRHLLWLICIWWGVERHGVLGKWRSDHWKHSKKQSWAEGSDRTLSEVLREHCSHNLLNELEELTGRVMTLHPPKIPMPWCPKPVNKLPCIVKDILQGWLRILRLGDYPGKPNIITRVLVGSRRRWKGESQRDGRRKRLIPMLLALKAKNAGGVQKLKKARKWIICQILKANVVPVMSWFSSTEALFWPLTSRPIRQYFFVIFKPWTWGDLV